MIDFSSYKEIVNRIRSDIQQNLPGTDPTIFGSFVRAFADSLAGRSFDITVLQEQLLIQMFPQTATGEFLELWAEYSNITRNPATGSNGPVTFTGTVASVIPAGTQVRDASGNIFETDTSLALSAQVISITSLTRSGNVVTATTSSDNHLGSGQEVDVVGAVETDYNGTQTITVTGSDTFTFLIDTTPSSPATGTITAEFDGGFVDVTSVNTGADQNLDSGAQLSLVTPIAGVDTTAFVQFGEVGGGTDTESDDDLRSRLFQARANPVANFNVAAIEKQARSIAGVTRVKIKRITPYIGGVTILFVRDNDPNIIPSASEVTAVKDAILEILQASSSEDDVFVTAPTPVTTDFTFSAIDPDTPTMRTAIEENLKAFYEDEVDFETDITEDKYRSAIINTIDPETGDSLISFTLTSPSADITVSTDEIGVLGDVTF